MSENNRKERLLAESISVRRKPVNLTGADWAYFAHESTKRIPASFVQTERDVFTGTCDEGIIFRNLRPLQISFPSSSFRKSFPGKSTLAKTKFAAKFLWKCAARSLFPAPTLKEAVWITDTWSGSFFHWMMDALPRLLAYQITHKRITLLLPQNLSQMSHVLESLEAFEIEEIHFTGSLTFCETLHIPTHTAPSGNYNEALILHLSDFLSNHFTSTVTSKNSPELLYISRSKAKRRKIANENECTALLKQLGFEIVCLEDLTLRQQANLCRNAKVLVANHGAGLTNMLFMRARTKVVELRKEGDNSNNCFYALASALGIDYFYLICGAPKPSENPHTSDIIVDCKKLEKVLTQAIGDPIHQARSLNNTQ